MVEVNVVDTSGSKKLDDVTFPRPDPAGHSSWSAGGNSIRLTGDTIRELGADGWFTCSSQYIVYSVLTAFLLFSMCF